MTNMETMTSVVFALGVLAVVVAWVVSYVLITKDKIAGPATTTSATDARELATASSN